MRDADSYFEHLVSKGIPASHVAPLMAWSAALPFNADAPTAGDALLVYGNHDRWVVDCDHCPGAQLASRDDPRFMCVNCGNAYQGGAFRPIEWPKDHEQLERLIDKREDPSLRNWRPGESCEQIDAENELLREGVQS